MKIRAVIGYVCWYLGAGQFFMAMLMTLVWFESIAWSIVHHSKLPDSFWLIVLHLALAGCMGLMGWCLGVRPVNKEEGE